MECEKISSILDVDTKITIKDGLYGFEDYTIFQLHKCEYKPFVWLRSLEEQTLSFLLVDPFIFRPDYEIDVDDKTLSEIGISSPSDVLVMTIVTVPAGGKTVTANLQGPLIINKKTGCAKQVILGDAKWSTKHDILAESHGRKG